MDWFKLIKTRRGKRLDHNMERILREKLTTPMSTYQIIGLLSDGIREINDGRKLTNQRPLSTRGIPDRLSLPHMLKVHPNIRIIPGHTAEYVWEE